MRWFWVAILVTGLCLSPACDRKKDQYAGLDDLVAERQEIRKSISEENARKKRLAQLQEGENERRQENAAKENEPVSSEIVYEKQIEILDSDSKIILARGVAYMNKSGQIVKIKVYRK